MSGEGKAVSLSPGQRPDLATVLRAIGACADPGEAVPWAVPYGADWERALAECLDRRWLTWLAGALMRRGHLRREVIVLCACACARTALQHVPSGEDRPLRAIETAEQRARGEATVDEVRAARRGAQDAADAAASYAAAYYAASYAAYADADAACVYAASYAADAADAASRKTAETDLLAITRRELGAALIEGLAAYAATLPEVTP